MRPFKNFVLIFTCLGAIIIGCEKENPPVEITGELFSNSQCKDFFKTGPDDSITPDTLSCIEFSFNKTDSILTIEHINAGFNCCPEELWCEVTTKGDTILIEEFEKSAMCDCDCLYDLDIVLNAVVEGKYHIKIIEPYARDEEQLIFEIDLANETSGSFCAVRKRYPWGIHSI